MKVLRRLARNPLAWTGGVIAVLILFAAVLGPTLAPYDVNRPDLRERLQAPSFRHLLGTDHTGADVLSRILYGARVSLVIGVGASALTLVLGVLFGTLAGYHGGWLDHLVMRMVDVWLAFPELLLVIILAAVMGPSLVSVFLAIGLANWAPVARLVRSQVLSLRERDFVTAARALGADDLTILLRHILTNCTSLLLVVFTMRLGTMILAEASLTFLGLGSVNQANSWGLMVRFAGSDFDRYWQALFPATAIALTVVGFNLLGDALRDALDPTFRLNR